MEKCVTGKFEVSCTLVDRFQIDRQRERKIGKRPKILNLICRSKKAAAMLSFTLLCFPFSPLYAQAVTEQVRLDFGFIQADPGSVNITITTADVLSGTAVQLGGTPTHGEYKIFKGGGKCNSLDVDITDGGGVPGITLSNINGVWQGVTIPSFPANIACPAGGADNKVMFIGATATINPATGDGPFAPGITFNVIQN